MTFCASLDQIQLNEPLPVVPLFSVPTDDVAMEHVFAAHLLSRGWKRAHLPLFGIERLCARAAVSFVESGDFAYWLALLVLGALLPNTVFARRRSVPGWRLRCPLARMLENQQAQAPDR